MRHASFREVRAALSGPAVAADRAVVVPTSGGFRLSFLENNGSPDDPHHRASVLLIRENLEALAEMARSALEEKEND